MKEDVRPPLIGDHETEPLRGVEPFNMPTDDTVSVQLPNPFVLPGHGYDRARHSSIDNP